MYRVWYSTESFADYIIDNTKLSTEKVVKNKIYESDAKSPNNFHTLPDHIKKILYLDSPDLIVEYESEPIFSIEITTEAGTGHNAFQRFARIAAAVENSVPAIYIYPEASIVPRDVKVKGKVVGKRYTWDEINPLVFTALESVMSIYSIPALLYYFPSNYNSVKVPGQKHYLDHKGLNLETNYKYAGCPIATDSEMKKLFEALNEIIDKTRSLGVIEGRQKSLSSLVIRERRDFLNQQYTLKSNGKSKDEMSPITATMDIPTEYLINYLKKYEDSSYKIGELLKSRKRSIVYQIDAGFRGDPYPGCLSALDYLKCREGKTFEDRKHNLILLWGKLEIDDLNKTIKIVGAGKGTINDYVKDVKACTNKILLSKSYSELRNKDIPRYYMQSRYGSMYSKVKHIRVFSYFADAILFPDGSLWRDA